MSSQAGQAHSVCPGPWVKTCAGSVFAPGIGWPSALCACGHVAAPPAIQCRPHVRPSSLVRLFVGYPPASRRDARTRACLEWARPPPEMHENPVPGRWGWGWDRGFRLSASEARAVPLRGTTARTGESPVPQCCGRVFDAAASRLVSTLGGSGKTRVRSLETVYLGSEGLEGL